MSPAPCRIGLVGFGTVGSAVARRLVRHPVPNLALTHIFDRRAPHKRRIFEAENAENLENPENRENPENPGLIWTDRIEDVLTSDVDVILEAIGGVDPAVEWLRRALLAGKSIVTSNKQAVAHHGPALQVLAARQGRQLRFEAAVGGAMPIVRAVGEGLAGDRIQRIIGILNGTTNVVLSRIDAAGCSLSDALNDARAQGYAEADPAADLDGVDAAAKLVILCALAFGVRVDPQAVEIPFVRSPDPRRFRRRTPSRRDDSTTGVRGIRRQTWRAHGVGRASARRPRLFLWPHDSCEKCRGGYGRIRRRRPDIRHGSRRRCDGGCDCRGPAGGCSRSGGNRAGAIVVGAASCCRPFEQGRKGSSRRARRRGARGLQRCGARS